MQDERSISQDRLYYRIGEVSRITGLKAHVLRYWETEFRVIKPYKGGSLQRLYRKKDLDTILRIKRLLYEEGFTIAGAKKKIRDLERGNEKKIMRRADMRPGDPDRELLVEVREELEEIRKILE